MRYGRLVLGFLIIALTVWAIIGEQMTGVSSDAVVNARFSTIRTPITEDTLRIRGHLYDLGVSGIIRLRGVVDIKATVIATTADGARLRLQTTDAQKEALLLRFYADGEAPGVESALMPALARDLARRFSFNN